MKTTIHSSGYSWILFHDFRRIQEHRWSSLGAPASTSLCIQPIWEHLGAAGRISVAVRSCWVVRLWLPNHFTFCWCGTPVLVIRHPSYSQRWPECPLRVQFSPPIDVSKVTHHILSDTPGGSQWLKYILLMLQCNIWIIRPFFCAPSGQASSYCPWSTVWEIWLDLKEHTIHTCCSPLGSHISDDHTKPDCNSPVRWYLQSDIPE